MPGVRDIKIRFSGDSSGLQRAAAQGEQSVGKFSDRTQRVAKVALAGVGAFAAGIGLALKGGVQGLQEGEEAEAKFADALSRSTKGIRGQADQLKANAEQLQKNTRFTYEEGLAISSAVAQHASLSGVVRKGITDAVGLTNITADLATVMKTDGATAAEQLAKAMAKPESASKFLTKAGVDLSTAQETQIKAWVKSGDVASAQGFILDKLKEKSEGAAIAAGQTTAGQLARAQNAFGEVQEQLAVGLMPAITDLMAWLVRVTAWAQDNPGKVKLVVIVLGSLAAVIGTVSLAITAWSAITRTATAVQAAWNVVMAANPLVLVTLAVIALVAAIVLIATKTTWFQQIWKAAWGGIQKAVSAVFGWVKSNWPLLLAILTGPFGLAVLAIAKNWDKIVSTVKGIPGRIKSALGNMLETLKQAGVDLVQGMINGVTETAGRLASTIKDQLVNAPKKLLEGVAGWAFGSPSKVTTRYGKYITEGFIKGIELTGPRLLAAQQLLHDKLKAKVDKAKDIAAGIRQAFTLDLSATTTDSETGERGASIFTRLAQQAAQAERFASVIQRLRKGGLKQNLLDQLIQGGPSSLAAAEEIGTNIGAANSLAGRIGAAGDALATSETLARTGINIAAPVVNVAVTLDGKEIKAIVKSEVEAKDRKTKQAVQAGARRAFA